MKRVFTAIAATFGFLGVAVVVIFFAETTAGFNFNLSPNSLTADIAANNPLNLGANLSTNINPADGSAVPAPVTANPSVVPNPFADASTTAPTTTVATTPTPTPEPVVTPPPTPSVPPSAIPPYADASDIPPITDVATATVTVTPTAPPPPPVQQGALADASSIGQGLALPYNESNFRGDTYWQTTWGTLTVTQANFLDLSAGTQSIGGGIYLKNSGAWSNYTADATLDWVGGQTFGLMANYDDASNYLLCVYTKSAPGIITVRLVQYIKGYATTLTPDLAIPWDGNGSNLDASIAVSGIYGTCSLQGPTIQKVVATNEVVGPGVIPMSASGSGGIGFIVNDPEAAASEIIIKSLRIASK